MTENFPNLVQELDIQVHEAQRVPNMMNPMRHQPRHIIVKMSKIKNKNRILKADREKQLLIYKRAPETLSVPFNRNFAD